ncbi:MAG: HEAT repeat domain-containing protein [Verrucomicrobia bacterium]|nr:HEAT repeat domain-containing protein [Verrucomicrobiota bacterium]
MIRSNKLQSLAVRAIHAVLLSIASVHLAFAGSLYHGESVAELIERLKSGDGGIRAGAITELGRRGSRAAEAVPGLVAVIEGDEDRYVRQEAAMALGLIQSRPDLAIPALANLLREERRSSYRQTVMSALGQFGHAAAPAIPVLEKITQDENAELRVAAARALGEIGVPDDEIIPVLVAALEDESSASTAASGALMEMGARAIPSLISALNHPNERARDYAEQTLGRIGEPAIPALLRSLDHPSPRVRMYAASGLEHVFTYRRQPAVVDALRRLLQDGSVEVRRNAAKALAAYGEQSLPAASRLLELLADYDEETRAAAAAALGAMHAEEAIPKIIQLLGDPNASVRADAAGALGMGLNASSAVPDLIRLLGDSDVTVRRSAAFAMSFIGSDAKAAIPTLTTMLSDEERATRGLAITALGGRDPSIPGIGTPAIPVVREALRNGSDHGRAAAATVLGRMRGQAEAAVPDLVNALEDTSAEVRLRAAWALGQIEIETGNVVAALIKALDDPVPKVREAAVEALGNLDGAASESVPAITKLVRATADLDAPASELKADVSYDVNRLEREFRIGKVSGDTLRNAKESNARIASRIASRDEAIRQRSPVLYEAARALGRIGPGARDSAGILVKLLNSRERDGARGQAAEALGKIDPKPELAVPALVEALDDSDELVRRAAITALGTLGARARDAVPKLQAITEYPPTEWEHIKAAWAWARISQDDRAPTGILIQVLETGSDSRRDEAARALGELGSQASTAVPGLVRILSHETGLPPAVAIEALRKIGVATPESVEALNRIMREGRLSWSVTAAWTLAELTPSPEEALGVLTNALVERDAGMQQYAAMALSSLGEKGRPAIPDLRAAAKSTHNPFLREHFTTAARELAKGSPKTGAERD